MQHIRTPGVAVSIRRRMLDLIADMSCQSWASLGFETLGHDEYERGFEHGCFQAYAGTAGSGAMHNRTYHEGVSICFAKGFTYTCLYTSG